MAARHQIFLAALASAVALAGCGDFDIDMRNLGNGFDTTEGAQLATEPRPAPNAQGLISYPGYQVAIARQGDTVSDVATRVGTDPVELARFNGIRDGVSLRSGETLVIPNSGGRVGTVDVAAVAGSAIDRAGQTGTVTQAIIEPAGTEPRRHRVQAGETAFSIARIYSVSPSALADWNGLNSNFDVRAGQLLLIPVPVAGATVATAANTTTRPGQGSVAPVPPSAATPLPEEDIEPAVAVATPEQPDLSQDRSTSSRLQMPVSGSIVAPYEKGKNDGIRISASAGAPVVAAGNGTVAAITRDTDQVPILVLRHEGNLLTVYAGVEDLAVEKGDRVSRGQPVAKVRSSGQPVLHFEVRDGFESVDPVPYLN
ncbi:MAG: LysM peptidoglycan-binding domain-containing protein [Pseudomonadota bacterium]